MSITLFSLNPGASGVAQNVHAVLVKCGKLHVPEIEIEKFEGNEKRKTEKGQASKLTARSNLFLVERFAMPDPHHDGLSVIVYRTTLHMLGKAYVATCYTNARGSPEPHIVDLSHKGLQEISKHVGKISGIGIWESLLRADRLERISAF